MKAKVAEAAPKGAGSGRAGEKLRAFHEEHGMGRAYDGALLKRLWPFIRPHQGFLVLSVLTIVVTAVINLIRPAVMGDVVGAKNGDDVFRGGMQLTALLLVLQVFTFVQMYTMQIVGARSMADLRAAVFDHLQRLSLRFFDKTPVGRLVTRATNDVDALGELFASGVLSAIGDVILLVGIVTKMVHLDWQMSLIAFAGLPVVIGIVILVRKRSREAYRDIRVKTARLNAFLNEQVSGIAVVQAFARERAMAREFGEINESYRDANKRSVFYEAILDAAIEMVGTLCIASILWGAGLRNVAGHAVTFAQLVTLTQYIKLFFEPISLISGRYTVLQSAMSGAERIFALLDETDVESSAPRHEVAASPSSSDEMVAFSQVTFGYKPGLHVLHNVSFSAKRGEKIALVGATGAGKSSVLSLLLRLYETSEGVIRVGGRDIRGESIDELRASFAVVPQDVFLFSGTVASNIAMSATAIDYARVEGALRQIDALDIFKRRDGGLDARVDERGANFSAGERQLLAFARAVYRDSPVLVLDEATASVDSTTEAQLQRALAAVMVGRTAIMVAHRLSTIRSADKIIVLHKGRVVEVGSHDELILAGGVYSRLYRMQFAHERVASDELLTSPPAVVSV